MVIHIKRLLKKPKVFLRLTGVTVEEFHQICVKAAPVWHERVESSKHVSGRPFGLYSMETHILCLLIYYRTYITQEFIGMLFNVDDSCICRSLRRISRVLAPVMAIKKVRCVPCDEAMDLIIDCTEQPIERPSRKQKRYYSGKKKAHTLKTEIHITEEGRITHISNPSAGKNHDMTIRGQGPPLHQHVTAYVDSGYQGLHKGHANTQYPYKRSKYHPLTSEERHYNKGLSRYRVRVENKIRDLKVFRFLGDKHRNRRKEYGIAVNIIAGIVNYKHGF